MSDKCKHEVKIQHRTYKEYQCEHCRELFSESELAVHTSDIIKDLEAKVSEQANKIKELNKDVQLNRHARVSWKKEHDRISQEHFELEAKVEKLTSTLKELLKYGNHDGACNNVLDDGTYDGACSIHLEVAKQREENARKVLREAQK